MTDPQNIRPFVKEHTVLELDFKMNAAGASSADPNALAYSERIFEAALPQEDAKKLCYLGIYISVIEADTVDAAITDQTETVEFSQEEVPKQRKGPFTLRFLMYHELWTPIERDGGEAEQARREAVTRTRSMAAQIIYNCAGDSGRSTFIALQRRWLELTDESS